VGNRKFILFTMLYIAVLVFLGSMSFFSDYSQVHILKVFANKQGHQTTSYYDLPRMTLSSAPINGKTGHMKVTISLEVADGDKERLADYQPRIMDRVFNYFRSVTKQDMRSKDQIELLRHNLLQEINMVTGPVHVMGIAFRELTLT